MNGKIEYNPCSFYDGSIKTTTDVDIEEVWNSDELYQLQEASLNNEEIQGCHHCYNEEKNGLNSRRLGAAEYYNSYLNDIDINQPSPQGIDYSVGNLCNLKCVICGPMNSSAWISDYKKLNPTKSITEYKYKKNEIKLLENNTLLKNIKSIHFHGGGEPLMSDFHKKLLKRIQEIKGLRDVRVFYNTNGTLTVSDEVLSLWEECKLIEIYFSIDDVEHRFDYQRYGTTWNHVTSVVEWYKDNMPHNHMFNINCTWGMLNLYYLDELVDWWKNNLLTNRYGDPVNLIFQKVMGKCGINYISKYNKEILLNKFSNYNNLVNIVNSINVSKSVNNGGFLNYIKKLDNIRNTSFKKTFPEWSAMI